MKIIYYEIAETSSTNLTAKELGNYFCPQALTVVFTQKQIHGKGQFGRTWHSSHKDFTASFCFFIRANDIDSALLFRLGTESVLRLIHTFGISDAIIRWPNDVLVKGKKLCGVLCETTPTQEGFYIIIGIGINGNSNEEAFKCIEQPAISLYMLLNRTVILDQIKEQLSQEVYYTIKKHLQPSLLYF